MQTRSTIFSIFLSIVLTKISKARTQNLFFLILLSIPTFAQTTYYVSQSGNDANNGTSAATPWKHLNKISGGTFVAGDQILFKRGDTLYGEISKQGAGFIGTEANPIVFATYGTGAKPILMGDCSEGTWVRRAGYDSIWCKFIGYAASVQGYCDNGGVNVLMDAKNGEIKFYLSHQDSLNKYLKSFTKTSYGPASWEGWDTMYVKTWDGNSPSSATNNVILFRNNIWSGRWLVIRDLEFRSYQTSINPYPMMNSIIRNCEFRDNRYISVFLAGYSSYNLVDSCTVHNGGYTGMYSWYSRGNRFAHDTVRNISPTVRGTVGGAEHAGFGAERDTASVWEYCVVDSCQAGGFDSFYNMQDTIRYCIFNQGVVGGIFLNGDSWVIHNNTISSSNGVVVSIGRYHTLPVGSLGQMHVYNNTIIVKGVGYSTAGRGFGFASNGGDLTYGNGSQGSVLFENNTITGTAGNSNLCKHDTLAGLTSINNHFFSPGRWNASKYPNEVFYTKLSAFQAATGLESGSTIDGIGSLSGTLDATPDTLQTPGGTVTLRWTSTNATSATIDQGIGTVGLNSSITLNVTQDKIFILTLSNGTTTVKCSTDVALVNPLPVQLTSFVGSVKGRTVELAWKTATEVNSNTFEIERRTLAQSQWVRIGALSAAGTSNTPHEYAYVDNLKYAGTGNILYRLKTIDNDGSFRYSSEVEVVPLPIAFSLEQNYPNPFNPQTKIQYSLPENAYVQLNIYDMIGREVAQLTNEDQIAGYYEKMFTSANLSSGVYFYRVTAQAQGKNTFTQIKKMLLIK